MSNPPDAPNTPRRRFRPLRLLRWLVFLALLLPVGGVVAHGVIPPPMTLLMAQRAAQGEGWSYRWRPLEQISPRLVEAVIAAEDAKFCRHHGFDLEAIEKALERNGRRPDRLRGGSTISQQVAKNVFLWPGRSWTRKGLEAGYTVLIELFWSKRRIMEVYLNVAEWAPGVYGAQAASRRWFGRDADELTATQASRLAAILPSPRRYRADAGRYVRRRAGRIGAGMGAVRGDGLAACVLERGER